MKLLQTKIVANGNGGGYPWDVRTEPAQHRVTLLGVEVPIPDKWETSLAVDGYRELILPGKFLGHHGWHCFVSFSMSSPPQAKRFYL